mmetsp:Transcript_19969/g.42849  ORF Transcript_19969/g.42849 Transcript_19969/m.42849 type:complete len:337 (+) Transcript_19969:2162-3172(+)
MARQAEAYVDHLVVNAVELCRDRLDFHRCRAALFPLLFLPRFLQERRQFLGAIHQVIMGLVEAVHGDVSIGLGRRRARRGSFAAVIKAASSPPSDAFFIRISLAPQVSVREVLADRRADRLMPPPPPTLATAIFLLLVVHVRQLLQQIQRVAQQAPLTMAVLSPRHPVMLQEDVSLELFQAAREAVAAEGEPPHPLALDAPLREAGDVEQLDVGGAGGASQEVGGVLAGAVELEEAQEHGGVHLDNVRIEDRRGRGGRRRTRFISHSKGGPVHHQRGNVLRSQQFDVLDEAVFPQNQSELGDIGHEVVKVGIQHGAHRRRGGRKFIIRYPCSPSRG